MTTNNMVIVYSYSGRAINFMPKVTRCSRLLEMQVELIRPHMSLPLYPKLPFVP